jgi:hypothetical protein
MESGYEANGWLGPLIAGKIYVDFSSNTRSFEESMEDLRSQLIQLGVRPTNNI